MEAVGTTEGRCALFVAVEYFKSTVFSGNGVLGRSYVHGLARAGVAVKVVSAWPCDDWETAAVVVESEEVDSTPGGARPRSGSIVSAKIPVPPGLWKRLDRSSCWSEFAKRATKWAAAEEDNETAAWADFVGQDPKQHPQLGIAVDWTGFNTLDSLVEVAKVFTQGATPLPRVFLNFRVFANKTLLASGQLNQDDFDFYNQHELRALMHRDTVKSVALCPTDVSMLEAEQEKALLKTTGTGDQTTVKKLEFLLPPLRADSLAVAQSLNKAGESGEVQKQREGEASSGKSKKFITCCVRLIPDKNALFFSEVMGCLQKRGTLTKYGLTPFLCGAAADAEYTAKVQSTLLEHCPDANISRSFLTSLEMATIYTQSALNFHPCLYDAYGMTVVEAASVGCPSIINGQPLISMDPKAPSYQCHVGASELLEPNFKAPEVYLGTMGQGGCWEPNREQDADAEEGENTQRGEDFGTSTGDQPAMSLPPTLPQGPSLGNIIVEGMAKQIEDLLDEKGANWRHPLPAVGARAQARAMTWTEDQAVAKLMKYAGW